ncbi:hypothetical protein [Nitrosopumilus ureiphilus]|uniref:Uncharacterized protein n=1 Tax=Nitrosopumilus ureiphilus TaxID=1470067 RepID=A0A7D5M7K5_9ARCH|nr:hypothetical protein [Nitrosopumilus ureiphilus]QLH06907.1 hypothetical protein C5F50_07345 [Nitrosopumilus ureiphilus]
MVANSKLDSNYLAITELTFEINSIVQESLDNVHKELSSSDVEYILKIIFDMAYKIRLPLKELTV